MTREKIMFDDSSGRVEYRNGVQSCIFETETGKEVLYRRDDRDNVVKIFDGQLDSEDAVKSRGIAGQKLTDKKFLIKDQNRTVKRVTSPVPARPVFAPVKQKPDWLKTKLALAHASKIDPHEGEL